MFVCILAYERLKKALFTSNMDLDLRKQVLNCYK